MRVDNSHLASISLWETQSTAALGAAAPPSDVKPEQSSRDSSHVPSGELAAFRQTLQSIPVVREAEVARVAALLASGYYATDDAAQRTAEALIRAAD